MLDEITWRTGQLPKSLLADANHAKHDCIRAATAAGVDVIVAVPTRTRNGGTQADDDSAIVAWRERMDTDEAKKLYRAREHVRVDERASAHAPRRRSLP